MQERNLTIEEGAYLTLGSEVNVTISSGASLTAIGTADKKIILTSVGRDGNGNWSGILVSSDNSNNLLEHTEISYAGGKDLIYLGGWRKANLGVSANSSVHLSNVTISDSNGYGVAVHATGEIIGIETATFINNSSGDEYTP